MHASKKIIRPTGIIRTLPSLRYGGDIGNISKINNIGRKRYELSIKWLEKGHVDAIYIALPQMPKIEVLHIYLLIEGEIQVRLNIAGYLPGDARKCWDNIIRLPRFWAVCTAPISFPPSPIRMRGFQGFRYTDNLW